MTKKKIFVIPILIIVFICGYLVYKQSKTCVVNGLKHYYNEINYVVEYMQNTDYDFMSISCQNGDVDIYASNNSVGDRLYVGDNLNLQKALTVIFDELKYSIIQKENAGVYFWKTNTLDLSVRGIAYSQSELLPREIEIKEYMPIQGFENYYYYTGR